MGSLPNQREFERSPWRSEIPYRPRERPSFLDLQKCDSSIFYKRLTMREWLDHGYEWKSRLRWGYFSFSHYCNLTSLFLWCWYFYSVLVSDKRRANRNSYYYKHMSKKWYILYIAFQTIFVMMIQRFLQLISIDWSLHLCYFSLSNTINGLIPSYLLA